MTTATIPITTEPSIHNERERQRVAEEIVLQKLGMNDVPRERTRFDPREIEFAEYQRDLDTAKLARYIKAGWQPALMQEVTVNVRDDNRVYGIDGRHRVAIARHFSIPLIDVKVFFGLTFEQEAELFYHINDDRKSLSVYEKWDARMAFKDEHALAITEVFTQHGLRLAPHGSSSRCVKAVAAVEKIYRAGGKELLSDTLAALMAIWHGQAESLTAYMLLATSYLFERHGGQIDLIKLHQKLSKFGPEDLDRRATKLQEDKRQLSLSRSYALYYTMCQVYNANLRAAIQLVPMRRSTARVGDAASQVKISDAQVEELREKWKTLPQNASTLEALSTVYNMDPESLRQIVMGKARVTAPRKYDPIEGPIRTNETKKESHEHDEQAD